MVTFILKSVRNFKLCEIYIFVSFRIYIFFDKNPVEIVKRVYLRSNLNRITIDVR